MPFSVANTPGSRVTIIIRDAWRWWKFVALPLFGMFLYGWFVYGDRASHGAVDAVFLVLFSGWLTLVWLGNLFRRDLLAFGDKEMTWTIELLVPLRSRRFLLSKLSKPFYLPKERDEDTTRRQSMAFDYGGRVIHIGAGLTQFEVNEIARIVREHCPELQTRWADANLYPMVDQKQFTTLDL